MTVGSIGTLDIIKSGLDFHLPPDLEAAEPPEARGLSRDEVRLMVSFVSQNRVEHAGFRDFPRYLCEGDVLAINTSGTLNAALNVTRLDGSVLELHLSTRLPADLWVVELRRPGPAGTQVFFEARAGERLALPGGATAQLLTPYRADQREAEAVVPAGGFAGVRLWIASLRLPGPVEGYLARYGFPIRYKYVRTGWPIDYYQTVYAREPGSAEMPSAGRAFTPGLLSMLERAGVVIAPLVLHTGVASLETHEPPYEEYYRVPAETARGVNDAHAAGKRVIAVGTTTVRALETTSEEGLANPGEGWTRLVITPARGLHVVDGLLTGFHEPRSSHLAMLEALSGAEHLRLAYQEALSHNYLWHEFGDLHLILP
jgi:S-adenosylmethionine:tRNA ribosyltransferase-isomerase